MRKLILINVALLSGLLMLLPQSFLDKTQLLAEKIDEEELIHQKEKKLKKFIVEMETLIKAAQDAGFSEKDIREMTITRNGKTIAIWEFLEQEKLNQKRAEQRRFIPRDRYLTVIDITTELESQESKELDSIRQEMIFVGTEEK